MVATLTQVLRKLLSQAQNWERMLADTVFAINVAKSEQTGYSAFWLMHGYQPKLPGELNIGAIHNDIEEFNVGDRVLCAIGARRWTLDPRFEGLYAIVGFRGKDIALIRRAATSGSDADTAVNIEQLCLYHERGDDADELADTSIGLQSGRGA
ncbi:hypothetical protein MTO96_001357 [Rhipicephalus appendiculatus]